LDDGPNGLRSFGDPSKPDSLIWPHSYREKGRIRGADLLDDTLTGHAKSIPMEEQYFLTAMVPEAYLQRLRRCVSWSEEGAVKASVMCDEYLSRACLGYGDLNAT
jgi:hypothetical protein